MRKKKSFITLGPTHEEKRNWVVKYEPTHINYNCKKDVTCNFAFGPKINPKYVLHTTLKLTT